MFGKKNEHHRRRITSRGCYLEADQFGRIRFDASNEITIIPSRRKTELWNKFTRERAGMKRIHSSDTFSECYTKWARRFNPIERQRPSKLSARKFLTRGPERSKDFHPLAKPCGVCLCVVYARYTLYDNRTQGRTDGNAIAQSRGPLRSLLTAQRWIVYNVEQIERKRTVWTFFFFFVCLYRMLVLFVPRYRILYRSNASFYRRFFRQSPSK